MKQGRGRAYPPIGGMEEEIQYLSELRARAADLVADLPEATRTQDLQGHSIQQLFHHLMEGEANWISQVAGMDSPPALQDIEQIANFSAKVLRGLSLETALSVGPFTTIGQVLRHLQWHWTYHSAQIGLLRKALGYPYQWTFQ